MIREAKRNNVNYRRHSLACLGTFIDARDNIDWFGRIVDIIKPIVVELVEGVDDMDVDSKQPLGPSSKTL